MLLFFKKKVAMYCIEVVLQAFLDPETTGWYHQFYVLEHNGPNFDLIKKKKAIADNKSNY